ncbi:DUF99 family protein [Candidatus Woesearchaeota archaeon]|nr:MAG: DUF99 family protein [Candidatus Woesearchaeota archaeon]
MKREIRVIGIDDAAFDKFSQEKTRIFGVVFRGGLFVEGVLSSEVDVDGGNATRVISEMILKSHFLPQLRAILLDGIAVAGFNLIDIHELNKRTGIPVIVVMRRLPKTDDMKDALKKLGMEDKISLLEKAGRIARAGKVFIQFAGIGESEAAEIVSLTATRSFIPEPLRVAHLIAQGFSLGESRGAA